MALRHVRTPHTGIRLLVVLAALLLTGPVFAADEPVIVGVTNLDLVDALMELHINQVNVRRVIDVSNAIAVTGDPVYLRTLPFVRYVEPDPPDAVWTQEDALEYGVHNVAAETVWGGFEGATNIIPGQGGAGIKVAVIDTGIDCGHEDLAGGCVYGANFVTSGAVPFDDYGHGTHVAGIIGARDNGLGTIGVAPEATLYAVKVLNSSGSGSFSAVALGIDWAVRNGMHVINMSLGGTTASQALADAVAAAEAAGVLVVSAAGNSGCCNKVGYPAKYAGSMAVAAVDSQDVLASFSSTGPEVDVSAPGVSVRSSVPTGTCKYCDPSGYKLLSGTSMATPHVAGVGALLMSRGRTAAETWSLMVGTAVDLGAIGRDDEYGYGRVDALAAVTGTPAPLPPPPPAPPADSVPPTASITSPTNGATVARYSTVTIEASASDDVGVTRVAFLVNGVPRCSRTTAPYTCAWQVWGAPGKIFRLRVRAYDAAGNVGPSSLVTVTVR
jgi:subtilisin family serine protease